MVYLAINIFQQTLGFVCGTDFSLSYYLKVNKQIGPMIWMGREEQRFSISKINILDKQNESQIYNQVLKIFCYLFNHKMQLPLLLTEFTH